MVGGSSDRRARFTLAVDTAGQRDHAARGGMHGGAPKRPHYADHCDAPVAPQRVRGYGPPLISPRAAHRVGRWRVRSLVPSLTSPITVVKHCAAAERVGFKRTVGGLAEAECDGYARETTAGGSCRRGRRSPWRSRGSRRLARGRGRTRGRRRRTRCSCTTQVTSVTCIERQTSATSLPLASSRSVWSGRIFRSPMRWMVASPFPAHDDGATR